MATETDQPAPSVEVAVENKEQQTPQPEQQEQKELQVPQEPKEPKESQEPQEPQEPKEPKEPKESKEPREKKDQKDQNKSQTKAPATTADAVGEKKLSGAELKKKAKEEKAARRAQVKATHAAQGPGTGGPSGDAGKGSKPKQKQDGQYPKATSRSAPPVQPIVKEVKPLIPECFSHLSMAKRISMTNADKDVHPVVLALGQQMSTLAISDSITRLEATLLAFKKVTISPFNRRPA